MLSEESISQISVSLNDLFCNFTNEFLKPFEKVKDPDIYNGIYLDFEIHNRSPKNKINPLLRLAKPEDAEDIVEIYKDLYQDSYPYKEMEDLEEVRSMIESDTCDWVIFKDKYNKTLGCFTFLFDFEEKKCYIRGLMIKKQYQGVVDVIKAVIGSYIGLYTKYKDKILIWYCENRTAHCKSQYALSLGGIKPIAFYPNKDVFLGKIESDIMHICYDERALQEYRSKDRPKFIPPVESCFKYSNNRFNLGKYHLTIPKIKLNYKLISKLKNKILKSRKRISFGYELIKFWFNDSNSYFKFIYTPSVNNFEKTEYKVKNLEELFVFAQKFIELKEEWGIRYCEIFLSAYHPEHQQIFYNTGLSPRGYIPSWKYNQNKCIFEDYILFNCFIGEISKDIQLIEEGKELLYVLNNKNNLE